MTNDANLRYRFSMLYRVVESRVERLHNGEWKVAYYCSSPEGAELRRQKCIERSVEWCKMDDAERRSSILR